MKPHRLSLILGVLLIAILALGTGGYVYTLRYLRTQTANLQDQLTQSAQADAELTSLAAVKTKYEKTIMPNLALIDTALPATKEQTDILAQLQRLAVSNGLTLSSISLPSPTGLPSATSQTSAVSGVLALPINFQLTGAYDQLQSYLTAVENLNRSTTVTSLAISRPGAGQPITYAITLNAYVKP